MSAKLAWKIRVAFLRIFNRKYLRQIDELCKEIGLERITGITVDPRLKHSHRSLCKGLIDVLEDMKAGNYEDFRDFAPRNVGMTSGFSRVGNEPICEPVIASCTARAGDTPNVFTIINPIREQP